LTEAQTASNREKSKTRAKVEHVFGNWVMTMGGKLVRAIGLERVRAQLGLKNGSSGATVISKPDGVQNPYPVRLLDESFQRSY
jgi:hypothetical protein